MKKHLSLLSLFMSLIILLASLAACAPSKKDPLKADVKEDIKDEKVEIVKNSIINAINDDIWYNGSYSDFNGFENEISDIEIYLNDDYPDLVYVYFNKKFDRKGGQLFINGESYCIINLWKGKTRGYKNRFHSYWMGNTEEDARKELNRLGYKLYKKDKIQFPQVSQPDFSDNKSDSETIINEIKEKLTKEMKDRFQLENGEYKAYIRHLRSNDYSTYVVLENSSGTLGIIEFTIEDDGHAYSSKYDILSNNVLKINAEQYKKVAIEYAISLM